MTEREILEQRIGDYRAALVAVEKQLIALNEPRPKPDPKHGNYKVSKNGAIQFFVKDGLPGPIRLCREALMFAGPLGDWDIIPDKDLAFEGNFIDDLRERAKQ